VRIAVGICALLLARAVAAQPAGPNPTDKAEADRLFEQARDLMTKGDRVEACKLFDLSLRKDPRAVGTMLNVALCREEGGAIATATRIYSEARDRARDQKLAEHADAAERKLALLAPRVPHLKITLPANAPVTTRVIVDDLVLSLDQLGDLTVDPGTRAIVVAAPDKLPYETTIEIKEAEHRVLVVPALQGAKTVIVQTSSRALYGKVGIASGALLVGLSLGLGYYAEHLYWSQFPAASRDGEDAIADGKNCYTYTDSRLTHQRHCNAVGAEHLKNATTLANVSTGVAIVGALAAGVGGYLWWTAPHVKVDVAPDHAGVAIVGRF
jgi:hypothetical protein